MTFVLPAHLTPDCGNDLYCVDCTAPVKLAPHGRWYVTMGHPGFNSHANNGNGYATKAMAVAAVRKFRNASLNAKKGA